VGLSSRQEHGEPNIGQDAIETRIPIRNAGVRDMVEAHPYGYRRRLRHEIREPRPRFQLKLKLYIG
jgi:hypothetical protein